MKSRDLGKYDYREILNQIETLREKEPTQKKVLTISDQSHNVFQILEALTSTDIEPSTFSSKMLFYIRNFLDSKTLKDIFCPETKFLFKPKNSDAVLSLADAIFDALKIQAGMLHLMQGEQNQRAAKAIKNIILNLAEIKQIDLNDFSVLARNNHENSLAKRFEWITASIAGLPKTGETQLSREAEAGWKAICSVLKATVREELLVNPKNFVITGFGLGSLSEFVETFKTNARDIYSNQDNRANFLDPLHLQAAIASDTTYQFGQKKYRMHEILHEILLVAEEDKNSQLYQNLDLTIQKLENHLYAITRNHLPDNALRMVQLLEKFREESWWPSNKAYYTSQINRLLKAQSEENAATVYSQIKKEFFSARQLELLSTTSLSNKSLLDAALGKLPNIPKELRREITGRLMRTEKLDGTALDINVKLFTKPYEAVLLPIANDFAKQSDELYLYFSSRKNASGKDAYAFKKHDKYSLLNDVFNNWFIPPKEHGVRYQYKDVEYAKVALYNMKKQILALPKKLAPHAGTLKIERNRDLGYVHDAFVALGCIFIPVIGVLITGYAMYRSYRDKGTVFFTHAPETMKVIPAAERSIRKLGKV